LAKDNDLLHFFECGCYTHMFTTHYTNDDGVIHVCFIFVNTAVIVSLLRGACAA